MNRLHFRHGKYSLHRAAIGPAPDQGTVRSLSENELKRANNDGFACAGFARDRVVTRSQLQGQLGNKGEIFDAQGCQHRTI